MVETFLTGACLGVLVGIGWRVHIIIEKLEDILDALSAGTPSSIPTTRITSIVDKLAVELYGDHLKINRIKAARVLGRAGAFGLPIGLKDAKVWTEQSYYAAGSGEAKEA